MRYSIRWKKASVTDAFFYLRVLITGLLFSLLMPLQAACLTDRYDETARVDRIYDGDTLRLNDGRKLRLIGINTPELARDTTPAEPWSSEAKSALQQLLASGSIKLRWGQEKTDRYGRLLSHVFTPDGQNVSEWLLNRGHGMALTVPPNNWGWSCYKQAEIRARDKLKGLWANPYFQPVSTQQLGKNSRGFRLVEGKIRRVGFSNSSIWLNLERDFAIRIKRRDLRYFNGVDFKRLRGQRISARGWLNEYNNRLRMRVKHPSALEIIKQEQQK